MKPIKSMKNNKSFITVSLVVLILAACIILYLYFIKHNKINFVDVPETTNVPETTVGTVGTVKTDSMMIEEPATTAFDTSGAVNSKLYGKDKPPEMVKPKGCSANNNLIDYCIDYSNCCTDSIMNASCFCQHPVVTSCKSDFDACMSEPSSKLLYTNTQLLDKCNSQNKACCSAYNSINTINPNAFNDSEKRTQTDNILCSTSAGSKIEDRKAKCAELCQTHPQCAAYTATMIDCTLFKAISEFKPRLDPLTGRPIINSSADFVIKK